MGIRSNVVLNLTENSFNKYVEFVKSHASSFEDFEFALGDSVFKDTDSNDYVIRWFDVMWYEFDSDYTHIALVEDALNMFEKDDLPFDFLMVTPECLYDGEAVRTRQNKTDELNTYTYADVVINDKYISDYKEIDINNFLKTDSNKAKEGDI